MNNFKLGGPKDDPSTLHALIAKQQRYQLLQQALKIVEFN